MEMAMTEATEMADEPKHQHLAELPDDEYLASADTKDKLPEPLQLQTEEI